MSATTSATTGRHYGLQRVCRAWERRARRSTRGARRRSAGGRATGPSAPRRPSPCARTSSCSRRFAPTWPGRRSRARAIGVHARLRIVDGIWVARTRVLRVMRAHGVLSPHRGRQGDPNRHACGTIITAAPRVMWGTDGVRVFTMADGWGWTFAAVDHWNAECVGWHVCKVGSRFAALEPIAQGLERLYGSVEADVARGLTLRMDHGSQYLSDHFRRSSTRYWGIATPASASSKSRKPTGSSNGGRTLKEQAIYGRVFRNLDDMRAAVAEFVEQYNQNWRLEKLGYQTPIEARARYELRSAA